jgi:hypothetical protein
MDLVAYGNQDLLFRSSQKKYIKLYKFTYTFFISSFISLNLEKDYSFYTNGHFY